MSRLPMLIQLRLVLSVYCRLLLFSYFKLNFQDPQDPYLATPMNRGCTIVPVVRGWLHDVGGRAVCSSSSASSVSRQISVVHCPAPTRHHHCVHTRKHYVPTLPGSISGAWACLWGK